jgi:hypothetical protein
MGCDMHLHIELEIDGEWEHYGHPNISRDYTLFAKMADVRNYAEIEPISVAKGVPDDMSKITKLNYERWDSDAHSASWLNIVEIMQLESWLKSRKTPDNNYLCYHLEHSILHTYLFGNSFSGTVKYPEDMEGLGIQDVRFVFWFDN